MCDGRGFDHDCIRKIYPPDSKRCVFHSELPDKPKDEMQEALGEMKKSGEFDCRGWVFLFDMDLRNQEFIGDARFDGAKFTGDAQFDGASFGGDAGFYLVSFAGYVAFGRTKFAGDAGFDGASFAGYVAFEQASFARAAWFDRASFARAAWFGRASFTGDAWFDGANFTGDAQFGWANFTGDARFDRASFAGDARFDRASFAKGPSFLDVRFRRAANFADTSFATATTLDGARFGPGGSFARTDLRLVTFRRCHLGGVALDEAYNLALAEFDECTWGIFWPQGWRRSRRVRVLLLLHNIPILGGLTRLLPVPLPIPSVVQEERAARRENTKSDYERAQRVYRLLRRSLEDYKHFQEANRFAYRELEMRRLAYLTRDRRWWLRLWGEVRANLLSFEALYHQLSGYGDTWWKPLVWLTLLLLVAPLVLAWSGLQQGGVSYRMAPGFGDGWWEASLDLLGAALRTATLLPDSTGPQPNFGAQLTLTFLRLASPFLALLFTLAVRRRFRR